MCPQMCWNIWRGGTEASAKNSGGSPDIGYLLCLSTFLSICLSVCRLPVVCLLYCSIYRHTLNVASSSSPMVPRTVWLSSSMLTTFARPTSKLLKPAHYQSLQLYEREEGRGYFTEYTSNIFHIFLQPGQAYFISDGKPINNFEFFKPLVRVTLLPKPSLLLVAL